MSLKKLPPSTIKLINSCQVITSVSSVIKELIENALDAGATNIEVTLINHGIDRIEVKDNGHGVKKEDVHFMCQKSYTSKIQDFDDLYKLCTYGFRGEALNSLCAVGKVSITTIAEGDDVAMSYEFDHNGLIINNKLSHIVKGTTVVVENLFKNFPVRKQFLTSGRRKTDEMKKVEQVVRTLAVIHPELRAVLTHNKFCLWRKNCVSTLRQSLVQIIAPTIVKQLTDIKYESNEVSFDLLVPSKGCNIVSTCYGNPGDATFLFINSRPIKNKTIEKIVQEVIFGFFGHEIRPGKYPTCFISIKLPPDGLDVNLEPNKTRVILKDMERIGNILKKQLLFYYLGPSNVPKEYLDKLDSDIDIDSLKRKIEECEKPEKKFKSDNNEEVHYMNSDDENNLEERGMSPKVNLHSDEPVSHDIVPTNEICSIVNNKEDVTAQENIFLGGEEEIFVDSSEDKELLAKVTEKLLIESSCSEKSVSNEGNKNISKENPKNAENITLSQWSRGEAKIGDIQVNFNEEDKNIPKEKPKNAENIDIENITLSQWSRGEVKIGEIQVNSSTVLLGDESKKEDNSFIDSFSLKQTENGSQAEVFTPERSVSSQMGCKEMAGFTKYASEITNKIFKNGECTSFTKVASELASKWREMHNTEKAEYLEKSKQKQKEKQDKHLASMRDKLQKFLEKSNEKKALKKRSYPTIIDLDINLESMKVLIQKRSLKSEQEFRILSELNDDILLAVKDLELYVFSKRRLRESYLFYENLRSMIVPLKVLETGIIVNKDVLGESLWSILVSMDTAIDVKSGSVIVSDIRISKNGLRLELLRGDPSRCSFMITDVPLHVAFFGIEDLKEILSLIEASDSELQLEDSRPLKIVTYIRGETIRFLSKNSLDSENINDDFGNWLINIKPKYKYCPHQKPVFKRINLKDFIK